MNQRKYVLTDASLLSYKPAVILLDHLVKLSYTESVSFTNVQAYIRLIGKLIYLTNNQLDITFFV